MNGSLCLAQLPISEATAIFRSDSISNIKIVLCNFHAFSKRESNHLLESMLDLEDVQQVMLEDDVLRSSASVSSN